MAGALDGIRILDLSNVVSGPMAVQLLADQGADVIKIEAPGAGDISRYVGGKRGGVAAMFTVLNRNKRSLVLDLKQDEAREILVELVGSADVLVQNFRPGAMSRMGLDYETLKKINDQLIYVSISGFGGDGPYAKRRVYDPIIQALAGYVSNQVAAGSGSPDLVKNIICDKATALTASQAITAALFARERGGGGQHVDVAMLDTGIAFLWPDGMWNNTFVGDGQETMPPLSDVYRVTATADGYVVYLILTDAEWHGMARAIERDELAKDPRFESLEKRVGNIDALLEILEHEIGKRSTAEICARLEAEDVPFAEVNDVAAVADDPQVKHRGTLAEMTHEQGGLMRQPSPVARFDATPSSIRFQAPALGEHTNEVLAELGLSNERIAALRKAGAVG